MYKRYQIFILLFILITSKVFAANFTSVQSGEWDDDATWGRTDGVYPGSGDNVTINWGHLVTFTGTSPNVEIDDLQIRSSLSIDGNLTVNGNFNFRDGASLIVGGKLTVNSDLRIRGNAEFGACEVNGDFTISYGTTTINGNLEVSGETTNSGTLTVTGDMASSDRLRNSGGASLTVGGDLDVNDDFQNSGTANISGSINIDGGLVNASGQNLTIDGDVNVTGDFDNNGSADIGGNCTVDGDLDIANGQELFITGQTDVGGDLINGGTFATEDNINIDGDINIRSGTTTVINGDFQHDGELSSLGTVIITGDYIPTGGDDINLNQYNGDFYVFGNSSNCNGSDCQYVQNYSDWQNSGEPASQYVNYNQGTKHYRSKNGGDWDDISTWQSSSDGTIWQDATETPTNNDESIIIRNGHIVAIDNDVAADELNIETGAELIVENGVVLTIEDGSSDDLTVNGTITNQGDIILNGSMLVNSAANYVHDVNGSDIPRASWNSESNCTIIGMTDDDPGNLDQAFGNFVWNCTNQSGNLFTGGDITVQGNFSLLAGNFTIANATNRTLTIQGNYTQSGGILDFNAGSSGQGIIELSGNMLNTTVDGSMTKSGFDSDNGVINFNGTGIQTLNFSNSNALKWTSINIEDGSYLQLNSDIALTGYNTAPEQYADFIVNGTINLGNNIVSDIAFNGASNSSHFELNSTGTLITANPEGIALAGANSGSIQINGTRNYSTDANYIFNGTSVQVSGNGFSGGNKLTIDNPFGVTLSEAASIDSLTLSSGILYTSNANMLLIDAPGGNSVTGYNSSNYISGPMQQRLSSATNIDVLFPVGKGTYNPIELINFNSSGEAIIQSEVFDADCGGSPGTNITDLNSNRHWQIEAISGSSNIIGTQLKVTDSSVLPNQAVLALSSSVSGVYNSISSAAPIGNTITSFNQSQLGYLVIGENNSNNGCQPTGEIIVEIYSVISGNDVEDLTDDPRFPDSPTFTFTRNAIDLSEGYSIGQNVYGSRMRGYIIPPETGEYYFYICSDDKSELWLSSDALPDNKVLVNSMDAWANYLNWNDPDVNASSPIHLTQGEPIYFEVLHKEGNGGDNCTVGWIKPSDYSSPLDRGNIELIQGNNLSTYFGPLNLSLNSLSLPTNSSANDGNISVVASGGFESYEYSIDGGNNWQTSPVFNNLTVGYYTIIVRDCAGVEKTLDIELYCYSEASMASNIRITRVEVGTINNASDPASKNSGYSDFTSISTDLAREGQYNLTVELNTDGANNVYSRAWFDWNRDGDFDDSGEEYDLGIVSNGIDQPTSLSPLQITVPAYAVLDSTRLRISCSIDNYPASCDVGFNGEVEDYSIMIQSKVVLVSFQNASQSTSSEIGNYFATIILSEISSLDVTVPFVIDAASTASLGLDYSYTPNTPDQVTIPAGDISRTIRISITPDIDIESDETVIINLGTPINGINGAINTHTLTIINDDTDDYDNDGIVNENDLDDDNDGITDCVEKGLSGLGVGSRFTISGDASIVSSSIIELVPEDYYQTGIAMYENKIDMGENFHFSFDAYLGDDEGADGIAIIFHNDPLGINAIGNTGEGMGAEGIQHGICLEIDIFRNPADGDPNEDHGCIWESDNMNNRLTTPIALPELEDDNWHEVYVQWDAVSSTISYSVDGNTAGTYTNTNIVNEYFNGNDEVFFGFSGATGGLRNVHQVRFNSLCELPALIDTDNDGIPDYWDTDSDGDGCYDVYEGGFSDANIPSLPGAVDSDGLVIGAPYSAPDDNNGNTVFDFQEDNTPIIITQPSDQQGCAGDDVSFTVAASSANEFQWQTYNTVNSEWENINESLAHFSGSTTNNFEIIGAPSDVFYKDYRVIIKNNGHRCDSIISNIVDLSYGPGCGNPPVTISDLFNLDCKNSLLNEPILDNDTDDIQIDSASVLIKDGGNVVPINNVLTDSYGNRWIVNNSGDISFTPAIGFVGSATIKYTVEDIDDLVSNESDITVTINPDIVDPVVSFTLAADTILLAFTSEETATSVYIDFENYIDATGQRNVNASSTDNCWVQSLSNSKTLSENGTGDYNLGETILTWEALDYSGNRSTKRQRVYTARENQFVINCPEDLNLGCNPLDWPEGAPTTELPSWLELLITEGILTCDVTVGSVLGAPSGTECNINRIRTYTAEFNIKRNGTTLFTISNQCQQNYQYIVDNENPQISSTGNHLEVANTIACIYNHTGTNWDASVSDNCDANPTIYYTLSGSTVGGGAPTYPTSLDGVDFNVDTTIVTWTATDECNNDTLAIDTIIIQNIYAVVNLTSIDYNCPELDPLKGFVPDNENYDVGATEIRFEVEIFNSDGVDWNFDYQLSPSTVVRAIAPISPNPQSNNNVLVESSIVKELIFYVQNQPGFSQKPVLEIFNISNNHGCQYNTTIKDSVHIKFMPQIGNFK